MPLICLLSPPQAEVRSLTEELRRAAEEAEERDGAAAEAAGDEGFRRGLAEGEARSHARAVRMAEEMAEAMAAERTCARVLSLGHTPALLCSLESCVGGCVCVIAL